MGQGLGKNHAGEVHDSLPLDPQLRTSNDGSDPTQLNGPEHQRQAVWAERTYSSTSSHEHAVIPFLEPGVRICITFNANN